MESEKLMPCDDRTCKCSDSYGICRSDEPCDKKPMTTSEPTTGEIVRALRCDGDANNCVDCRYATYDTAMILCDQEQNVRDAADRLESQEHKIADIENFHKEMLKDHKAQVAALTARAEQAERERDLAIKALSDYEDAIDPTVEQIMREFHGTERRGLPQEGEGV